jgi:hypothetical protein
MSNASITLINIIINIVHGLITEIRNRKAEQAFAHIAFTNKLSIL